MEYVNNNFNVEFYITSNQLSRGDKVSLGLSGLMGVIVGLLSSLLVNITLAEISISPFFTVYFGVIFVVLGSLMIFSVRNNQSHIIQSRKQFITKFALMIILSGLLSFLLEKDLVRSMDYKLKIPIYSLVGITVCFSVVFILLDLINYLVSLLQSEYDKQVIESKLQIYLILAMSILMGAVYGFIFGLMDLQD